MTAGRDDSARAQVWRDATGWMVDGPVPVTVAGKGRTASAGDGHGPVLTVGVAAPPAGQVAEALPLVGLRVRHGHFAVGTASIGAGPIAELIGPRSSVDRRCARNAIRGATATAAWVLRRRAVPGALSGAAPSPLLRAVLGAGPTFLATQARDGRTYVRCYAIDGRLSAVAKVVRRSADRSALHREEAALRELHELPTLRDSVPEVLAAGQTGAHGWLLTSAKTGRPAPVQVDAAIAAWLGLLVTPGRWASLADCPVVAETAVLVARGATPGWESWWQRIRPLLAANGGPRAIVHGDFVPWNMLITPSGPAVFDWETSRTDGLAGWDRAFFDLQTGIVKHGWDGVRLERQAGVLIELLSEHWYSREAAAAVVTCVLLRTGIEHEQAGNAGYARSVADALERMVPALPQPAT